MKTPLLWLFPIALAFFYGQTNLLAQEDLRAKVETMEKELQLLKESLAKQEEENRLKAERITNLEKGHEETRKSIETSKKAMEEYGLSIDRLHRVTHFLERVKLGGYGSVRFEANDLDDEKSTFTFRRFVLTTDAHITDRLETYMELELERFREIEYEKKTVSSTKNPLEIVEAIEGTPGSEIAIEQAWLGYKVTDWLNFNMGALLVPLGRFNIRHDDNMWNLPRRTLVDRGVPVLPVKAAWPELGAGFSGNFEVGEKGALDYRLYVVNGALFDFEKEDELASRAKTGGGKVEFETEFKPFTGTFSKDPKESKAVTGRVAYSPALGHEVGLSGYWGRYTPDFLESESVLSIGLDGLNKLGPFEVEYEYMYTNWGNTRNLARSFAQHALVKESKIKDSEDELELVFKPVNLAQVKHGYWVEFRYPFWPEVLSNTFLGRHFDNPRLIPTIRWEQVFFRHLMDSIEFKDGMLTEFNTVNRTLNRFTAGIAYSPHPLWRFQLAGEFTWANSEKSLDGLTNFLNAREDEEDAFALLFGLAFGF